MSHPVYVLSGEPFLAGEAIEKIRSEEGTDHLSETSFDAAVETPSLMAALETPSLLGDKRLVIVYDSQDLKKDNIEALERYLAQPSPYSVLVLVSTGRGKLDTVAKKVGAAVTLESPKGRKLAAWVRERSQQHRIKLDDRGAWALMDAVGPGLRDLDGALGQMATQLGEGAKIGQAQVREIFSRLADERIFAFTDGVGDRRLPVAMGALRRLLDQGDEPLAVLGALTNQVRRMLRARHYVDGGPRAVGDALGLPGWRAERLHRQARSYREEELVAALSLLAETDIEMKGGDLPPEVALERAVTQIVASVPS